GYVRRNAQLEAFLRTQGVAGGVNYVGTERAFDSISSRRLAAERGLLGAAQGRQQALSRAEGLVAPGEGLSIGDDIASFFAAFEELGLKADDPTARKQVLAAAQAVAEGFRSTAGGLAEQRADLFDEATGVTNELNQATKELAALNKQIVMAQEHDGARAELLDRRDELVDQISTKIGTSVIYNDDDTVTLLSSGAALVDRDKAAVVSVGLDTTGNLSFGFTSGSSTIDVTSKVDRGTLGGLRQARDQDLVKLQSDLDQLAFDFAGDVNALHQSGFGLDGLTGRPLFEATGGGPLPPPPGTAYAMSLAAAVAGNPDALAASSTAADIPGGNDLALGLAGLASTTMTGGGTPASRFAAITGEVGTLLQSTAGDVGLRSATVAHVESARESQSGVSLDEEMVALTKYQRAYEASLKVLQTADEMMAELMQRI
ncbi:MAG: flagellar hook-associated protein FlgK, partial [Myxococcales bacterium]|nr:flagellar hook-associated protein FlgK [Myxococcales bacterium]